MQPKISWEKLYSIWAKDFDSWPNVRGFIAENGLLNELKEVFNKKILDLGCGTGRLCIALSKKGANVTGVDKSEQMLDVFREKLSLESLNVEVIKKDILKLKLDKTFDIITMNLVIDNIRDLEGVFTIVKKHLKPNGQFLITSPIYFSETKESSEEEISILENKYRVIQFIHPDDEVKKLSVNYRLCLKEIKELRVDNSVKFIFDKKPHKPFSEYLGKHILTIYKFENE